MNLLIFCCLFMGINLSNINAYNGRIIRFRQLVQKKSANIDWCDYWLKLGVDRKECTHMLQMTTEPTTTTTTTEAPLSVCVNKFSKSSCMSDNRCESGLLCSEKSGSKCCHPPRGVCPTPEQIGFTCVVKLPISWCEHDRDCGNRDQKCCPTGCNYNICI